MTVTPGGLHNGTVRISAKADYAIRALLELASRQAREGPLTTETIAAAQDIPLRFLHQILADLRKSGLVTSRRGSNGGWRLTRPASTVTAADVIAAIDGSLATTVSIAGADPDQLDYPGPAQPLRQLWTALNRNVRVVLETTTLEDLTATGLPHQPASDSRGGRNMSQA